MVKKIKKKKSKQDKKRISTQERIQPGCNTRLEKRSPL